MISNKKLKRKVEELEIKVWKLENPCTVKVGDKYKGGKVFSVEFVKGVEFTYSMTVWDFNTRFNHYLIKTIKGNEIHTYYL